MADAVCSADGERTARGHFERLAAVEVQSVMHFLDCTSLLRLALCSRRLHADADSASAWRHQPAFQVMVGIHRSSLRIGACIRQSLLKHLPGVCVHVDGDMRDESVSALVDIPSVARLDLDQYACLSPEQWSRLIRSSAMDSLRELNMDSSSWRLFGQLGELARLPHLQKLRLSASMSQLAEPRDALARLAGLTSLRLWDASFSGGSLLPAVAQCTSLTDLHLTRPRLQGELFRELFTSPGLARLQRLVLSDLVAFGQSSVPAEDFVAAFQSLPALRELHLLNVQPVDSVLSAVALSPALAELTVQAWQGVNQASPAALADLLQRAPALRVRLRGLTPAPQYAALLVAHPLRLEVLLT